MTAPAPTAPLHGADLVRSERYVLGAALQDPAACAEAVALVPPERYSHESFTALADRVWDLFSEGAPVSIDTVGEHHRAAAFDCVMAAGTTHELAHHAALVNAAFAGRDGARRLRRAADHLARAPHRGEDPYGILRAVQDELSDLLLGARGPRADTHVCAAVAEALARVDDWQAGRASDYAPSGFYSLDRVTGGLPVGEQTILAAWTGAGKTALLGHSLRAVALAEIQRAEARAAESSAGADQVTDARPAPVLAFSAEMSREQLAHRLASGLSGLNLRTLRAGRSAPADYARYRDALARVAALEIHVDDEPAPTLAHLSARLHQVRQHAPEHRLAVVGVDYDEKVQTEGRTEELRVSAVAQGLKTLAKRFAAPVLALSQYKRVPSAWTLAPSDDWLRYSGKKEHEGAMIVHWSHPGYWVEKGVAAEGVRDYDPSRPERGHLVVTKNRFGPVGTVPLDFDRATTSFRDPNEPGTPGPVADLATRGTGWSPPSGGASGGAGTADYGDEPLPF